MAWKVRFHYTDGLGRESFTESTFTKRANLDAALKRAADRDERTEVREVAGPKPRINRDQIMRDLGLTKVRGSVSGRTYYE